ncbi:MAG TPA: P-loop NTPase fold protein [Pyrinomonadaceae bacterium]|jgi:hypothetical protein
MPAHIKGLTVDDTPTPTAGRKTARTGLAPRTRFWLAALIFVAASAVALKQPPYPDAVDRPAWASTGWRTPLWWFLYPLERNAPSRLPKIDCTLNAVYAVPGTNQVWAVGNKGMVVVSADGGRTWAKRGIESQQLTSAAATPTPTPAPTPAQASFLDLPDLISTAAAAPRPVPADAPEQSALAQGRTQPAPSPAASFTPPPVGLPDAPGSSGPPVQQRPPIDPTQGPATAGQTTAQPAGADAAAVAAAAMPPEDARLIAVYFADGQRGEAVSDLGTRFTTADGGARWTRGEVTHVEGRTVPAPFRALHITPGSTSFPDYQFLARNGLALIVTGDGSYGLSLTYFSRATANDLFFAPVWRVGLAAAAEGLIYRTEDGGATWQFQVLPRPDDLYGVYAVSAARAWCVGSAGNIFDTSDGGRVWRKLPSGTNSQLRAVHFLADGQRGWIVGGNGLILGTADGGVTWVHRTQGAEGPGGRYLWLPAPWYWLVCLGLVLGLRPWRRAEPPSAPPEESVADVLVSDRPLEEPRGDVLAFNAIALGLSRFLRNENTRPPLTLAVMGEWGTGKSSLMNLLRADLRSYGFRPVWFNAWHHQKEEHMLASLLENIKLQAVPEWWTADGLIFRARLLAHRLRHRWVYGLLLVALVSFVLFYLTLGGTEESLKALAERVLALLAAKKPDETAGGIGPALPLVVAVLAFLGAVWRGVTAFGVKPASLLASVSRGVGLRGLEAQTSFRQKFAAEFADVTHALGDQSLLIFIDDLDRCQPKNVLETLEAINFLTSSGECFVVVGMAREYVARCVGLAFKDVAEAMIDAPPGGGVTKEEEAQRKQIEFARQYLDKLLNIEVPVPAPRLEQSLELLVASTRAPAPEPTGAWARLRFWLADLLERGGQLALVGLLALLMLSLGYQLARSLAEAQADATREAATAPPAPSPAPAASPGGPQSVPTAAPAPAQTNEQARLTAGGRGRVSSAALPLLMLLGLGWLGWELLTRRPGLVVKDSPRFAKALTIWHPLVFAGQSTPRATKRFMNRVRYLAMRQRRPADSPPSALARFRTRLRAWLTGERPPAAAPPALPPEHAPIPDEALVALAAIQHFYPALLDDELALTAKLRLGKWAELGPDGKFKWILFDETRAKHAEEFGDWRKVAKHRESFRRMSESVKVR